MRDPSLLLLEILNRRIPPGGRGWQEQIEELTGVRMPDGLNATLQETLPSFDHEGFQAEFTAAARALGKAPLALSAAERDALVAEEVTWPLEGWPLDQLGRVVMIVMASSRLLPPELELLLGSCYRHGESRERQALLRGLPFASLPARFVPLAVDACRTNELPVFEAIACENPFPAEHFPDLNFNQMVLKAVFLGLRLDRIVDLDRRRSPELARMAADYASERAAAGRSVPEDLERILPDDESDDEDDEDDRVTRVPE